MTAYLLETQMTISAFDIGLCMAGYCFRSVCAVRFCSRMCCPVKGVSSAWLQGREGAAFVELGAGWQGRGTLTL